MDKLMWFTEAPVSFVLPLLNQSAVEEDPVTLACRLSKPNQKVIWFKDEVQISETDDKYQMGTSACNYTLTLPQASIDDTGMYKIKVEELESSATVIVYGERKKIMSKYNSTL